MPLIPLGFLASLAAGLTTGLGAIPVLFTKRAPDKLLDAMLGFAAGVMLAATAFSLLIPAIDIGGVWVTVAGLVIGAIFLGLLDRVIPHMHFISGREGPHSHLSRVWLLILAITLHNFPEGLSVGIGFGAGNIGAATALAIAIGLQNMPEGLAVALPLAREGYNRGRALWYATATGLIEPVGGLIGVTVVTIARPILPYGLAFAAGAMLYVVFDEMIPESHRKCHEREATFGGIVGFGLMMVLDTIFA